MIDSTSGKYLYSVARPIPLSSAILDIVTERSPCSVTSTAVVSNTVSRTARRCSSMVSFQSFGTASAYVPPPSRHHALTATECLDKAVGAADDETPGDRPHPLAVTTYGRTST